MIESTFAVVRAVGTEFLRRSLQPLIIAGMIIIGLPLLLGLWLTTISAWWWLFVVPCIAVAMLFLGVVLLVKRILRRVESELPLTKLQRDQVSGFVDKLERSVETVRTPYPMILFYIIRDIIRPRSDAFIKTVAEDSRTLGPDFIALQQTLKVPQP